MSLPDVVIPLNLKSQLIPRILWTVTAALAIVGFVSADQWLPHIEIVKDDLAATLIKALLFGLATYAGKNAGIEGLLSGVGKKP